MSFVMGLDPSLKKAGYVILDTDRQDDNTTVERGLLKTSPEDGILILRLLKQSAQVQEKIEKYNIKFVGMEAPFFDAFSTEQLFALNQFLHKIFLDKSMHIVCFPPQTLKKLVCPDVSVRDTHKAQMIHQAKTALNLHGHVLAEDVADAYWAGHFGKRYYKWCVEKSLPEEELGEYEREVFCGKHTYTRGPKKGSTDYKGIVFRENELYFNFEEIKRRINDAKAASQKEDGE
jgi:Holliday junction resolvasome RuvABC endonuclease subunit